MMRARQLFWWGADYLYAGWQQVRAVFRQRVPREFAEGSAELPAIILLPGVYETWIFLEPLAARLNARGYRVFSIPKLAYNRMPVLRSAEVVAAALRILAAENGLSECVLLAHSKGGLIGKQLMLGETPGVSIRSMIAIATPFAGSQYARYMLSPTLRAFSPRDKALLALAAQAKANERIVSIFAAFDPHIPGGSALAGAHNVQLPTAGHFRILSTAVLAEAVDEALAKVVG